MEGRCGLARAGIVAGFGRLGGVAGDALGTGLVDTVSGFRT
jgi:hypothetical protein